MRIGVYDPYLDTLGGGEKYMAFLASCLSRKHDVRLFWDNKEILDKLHKRFLIDTSNLHIDPNIFNTSVSILERIKKSRQYDVIVFLSDGSLPFLLCKKLYIHFQFPVEWVRTSLTTKLKLIRVNGIICNSYFTKHFIDKKLGVKSIVVYPPASGDHRDGINFKKEKIILSVGRFNLLSNGGTFKKQEVMISMFNELVNTYHLPDWKLVLIISVKQEEISQIERLTGNIDNLHVQLIINSSAKELQEYYSRASIYWHAAGFGENIVKHPELAEHFGIATVQAMEEGAVPVVISAGGQKEIVKDGENGLLWKTKEECIEKTLAIISDKELWQRLSKSAKERAKDFSLQKFCKEINAII